MITYFIIAIVFCLFCKELRDDPVCVKWGLSLAMGILFGSMISFIPQIIIRATNYKYTIVSKNIYSIPIVSVKNRSNISGSFFLGSGSIGEREYYIYFQQYEDGGIQKDKKPTYCTTLYERDEQPRLEWTEVTKKAPWYIRFGFDCWDISTTRDGNYRLIIPEGTVLLRFEID